MFEDDYWDRPAYNDFWRGAPGLPPHTRTRPNYGPLQIRSPEELEIDKKYLLKYFNGVREFSWIILITEKDEKKFYYKVLSPPGAMIDFNKENEKYLCQIDFADCSILPYEKTGLWNMDGNCVLRIVK